MNHSPSSPPAPIWPRLRLDFYDTDIIMTRWEDAHRLTSYPVAVDDVVSACNQVTLGSGWLPPDTLFWKKQGNQVALALFVPARRWRLATANRTYHLPLPPLLFYGSEASYRVFALKRRPDLYRQGPGQRLETQLYHFPGPNVYLTGSICRGETPFPSCAPHTIHQAVTLFLEGSLFNSDLSQGKCCTHPDDILQLWHRLDGRRRFPFSELVFSGQTLASLYEK
mgnify:CR=1 FL=1